MQASSHYYAPRGGLPGLRPIPRGRSGVGLASTDPTRPGPLTTVWYIASAASTVGLAYHGYRRNNSVGWAIGWALLGGIFWPVGWGVALAQGFGRPRRSGVTANRRKRRSSRRRRTSRRVG